MEERHALGERGERAAVRYLRRRGWRIVATNLRRGAEVDIVAERAGVVIGCEVKTRRRPDEDFPVVSERQRARITAALEGFLAAHGPRHLRQLRLDLMLVEPGALGMRVTHQPGALDPPS